MFITLLDNLTRFLAAASTMRCRPTFRPDHHEQQDKGGNS